jgi:hypothetical protein
MYARGILFGKMKYELGDHSYVRCPENGLSADIEFKTKGWVSGTYNAIGGVIRNDSTGEILYEISGLWSDEMFIKDMKVSQGCAFSVLKLTQNRPDIRKCSSTQCERNPVLRYADPWKSRMNGSRVSSGPRPRKPSRIATMNLQLRKRQRSRTGNGKKPQRELTTAWSGTLGCLGESGAVQGGRKRVRKTLSGSSTRKCGTGHPSRREDC